MAAKRSRSRRVRPAAAPLASLLLAVLLLLAVSGCGDDESETTTGAAATTTSSTTAETTTSEPAKKKPGKKKKQAKEQDEDPAPSSPNSALGGEQGQEFLDCVRENGGEPLLGADGNRSGLSFDPSELSEMSPKQREKALEELREQALERADRQQELIEARRTCVDLAPKEIKEAIESSGGGGYADRFAAVRECIADSGAEPGDDDYAEAVSECRREAGYGYPGAGQGRGPDGNG